MSIGRMSRGSSPELNETEENQSSTSIPAATCDIEMVVCRLCPNQIVGPVPPWYDEEMQEFVRNLCKHGDPDGDSIGSFSFCHECYPIMLGLWRLTGEYSSLLNRFDKTFHFMELKGHQSGSSTKGKLKLRRLKLKKMLVNMCKVVLMIGKNEKPGGSSANEEGQGEGSFAECDADDSNEAMDDVENDESNQDSVPNDQQFIPLEEQEFVDESVLMVGEWMETNHDVPGSQEVQIAQLMDVKQEVEELASDQEPENAEMTGNITALPIYVVNREKRKRFTFEGVQVTRMFGTGAHSKMELLQCGACDYNTPLQYPYDKKASPFMAIKTHILHNHKKVADLPKTRRATQPVCTLCFAKFESQRELTEHKTTHPPDAIPECDICQKPFPKSATLGEIMSHRFSHKNDEERDAAIAAGEQGVDNSKLSKKRFAKTDSGENTKKGRGNIRTPSLPEWTDLTCNLCIRSFDRQSSLTNHLKTHGIFRSSSSGQYKKRPRRRPEMRKGKRNSRKTIKNDNLDVTPSQEVAMDLSSRAAATLNSTEEEEGGEDRPGPFGEEAGQDHQIEELGLQETPPIVEVVESQQVKQATAGPSGTQKITEDQRRIFENLGLDLSDDDDDDVDDNLDVTPSQEVTLDLSSRAAVS